MARPGSHSQPGARVWGPPTQTAWAERGREADPPKEDQSAEVQKQRGGEAGKTQPSVHCICHQACLFPMEMTNFACSSRFGSKVSSSPIPWAGTKSSMPECHALLLSPQCSRGKRVRLWGQRVWVHISSLYFICWVTEDKALLSNHSILSEH